MKQANDSCKAAAARTREAAPARSMRTIYANALREVMSDPRKALAEHDPWLASLLGCGRPSPSAKG